MTTLINIDNYTTKFDEYPADLQDFAKENQITLPSIKNMRGQALALMSQPEVRGLQYLKRSETEKFLKNIGISAGDAIQAFNKSTGIKRMKMSGQYCLKYPFESDRVDIDKRKGAIIGGDRDSQINAIKSWWKEKLLDVPNEEWQVGHLDPTIGDPSENNLAYQPPLQGKYRDRFKFDRYFVKMWPTASEVVPKFDKYYTEVEQLAMYEALKEKFEPSAHKS